MERVGVANGNDVDSFKETMVAGEETFQLHTFTPVRFQRF